MYLRFHRALRGLAWTLACACALPVSAATQPAAAQMAADKGCYNCHGEPPRRGVRSSTEIAKAYQAYANQPAAEKQAVDRMHHGSLFSHVAAHERLSDDEAAALVRWLVEGGR